MKWHPPKNFPGVCVEAGGVVMWAAKRDRLYRVYVEYGLTPAQARCALWLDEAAPAAAPEPEPEPVHEAVPPSPPPSVEPPRSPLPMGSLRGAEPHGLALPHSTRAMVGYEDAPAFPRRLVVVDEVGPVPGRVWRSICERVPDPLAPLRGGGGRVR